MTRRPSLADYAGAIGRIDPERGIDLPVDRFGWMPKIDGSYVEIHTCASGRIRSALTREGRDVIDQLDGLGGLPIGLPRSVVQGEAEIWTESAIRTREIRGELWVHLFDVSRYRGEHVARRTFEARRALLHTWRAGVEAGVGRREVMDASRRWRDPRTGEFARPASENVRRLPIVELSRGGGAGRRLWQDYVDRGGGEGLVAVRLDAPMGARGSKLKLKLDGFVDAVVLERDGSAAILAWRGGRFVASCQGAKWIGLRRGDVVEVKHNGWLEGRMAPKFPRLHRVRRDRSPESVCLLWMACPSANLDGGDRAIGLQ